jgi:tetratricopeptide (TPR) repeat protein
MKRRILVTSWFAAALVLGTAAGARADVSALEASAKAPPKDPQAAFDLGIELRRAGSFDSALRVFRSAYPRAKGDLRGDLRLEAARTLIAKNQQKPALAECRGLKGISSVQQDVCVAEAQLLWKRASLALPAAEHALASSSDDYDALVAKARALRMMGKAQESDEAFRSAIQKNGNRYEAYMYRAELQDNSGKLQDAIESLRKATKVAPSEPEPWLWLGERLPAGSEAVSALEQAIKIRPRFGAALARLGEVQLEQGALADAEKSLKAAIAVDGKQADWHADYAHVLIAKKDHAGALKEAQAALKLVGNNASAKLAEADAIALRGDIDLAIEAYEKAASYARSNPAPLVHAARASLDGNRPTTARAFADRAVQSFADWGPAWEVLGDVAAQTKDRTAAKDAYKKALGAKRGRIDASSVKKKLAGLK